ncbi:MAG: response regulator [Opitutae bacterium]|nr:response regulator [Opitutae bacterium]
MTHPTQLASGDFPNPVADEPRPDPPPATEQEKFFEFNARVARALSDALMVINGHAALLMERESHAPETLQHAAAIYQAGEQAARVTRQLLLIGGRCALHFHAVDLHRLLHEVAPSIRSLLGPDRPVEIRLADRPAVVWADPELCEQVLLSLAANARDAMPHRGRLEITTECVSLAAADTALPPARRAGDFVCCSVRDTGCGMSPEVRAQIFDPLFTTKKIRKIAGLGLAAVQSVVHATGGWLTVDSQPGAGTTIKIFLPPAPAERVAEPAGDGAGATRRGKETILLVDDEPTLRELTALVLQNFGYRVLQAGDGAEALEVWKWHGQRVDLLFTDLVMPGDLSGLDLAARLQAEKPDLKVVCITGNADQFAGKNSPANPSVRFLQKPCSLRVVGQTIRLLLDRHDAHA